MKRTQSRIILNIDEATKEDFSKVCKDLNVNMTDVIKAGIIKFINKAKTSK